MDLTGKYTPSNGHAMVGMDMEGRRVSQSSFIIGRAQCCERNNTLHTRYTCIVRDGAEVATLSVPPPPLSPLPVCHMEVTC